MKRGSAMKMRMAYETVTAIKTVCTSSLLSQSGQFDEEDEELVSEADVLVSLSSFSSVEANGGAEVGGGGMPPERLPSS